MYNEEIKRRFIEEKIDGMLSPSSYYENIFKKAASYENELSKDLMNFSLDEIIELYKRIDTASIGVLRSCNSVYKTYTTWGIKENYRRGLENAYDAVAMDIMKSCVNMEARKAKILSRADIREMENVLLNASDVAIIECLFNGIKGRGLNEILELKISDIDENTGVISLVSGRKVQVDNHCVRCLMDAYEEEYYVSLFDSGRVFEYYPNPDGFVFKMMVSGRVNTQNGKRNYNTFYKRIKKILSYYGEENLSAQDIALSGQVHYIKMKCQENGISVNEFFRSPELTKEVEKRFLSNLKENYKNDIVKELLG